MNTNLIKIFFITTLIIICNTVWSQKAFEIDDVNFFQKDKEHFDKGDLEDAVAISKAKYFRIDMLQADVDRLKKYYFDNGFFDAGINTKVTYDGEDSLVTVNFIIEAKHQYRVYGIDYRGFDKIIDSVKKELDTITVMTIGDPFNKAQMRNQGNVILDHLQNRGYMNADYKQDSGMVVTKNDTSIYITYNFINIDTVYHFGKTVINIDTNKYDVSKDYLRKGVAYEEGEVYSKKKRMDTEKNISQMPIISSARVETTRFDGSNVDLEINTRLADKHELSPYAEVTNIDNYFYVGGGLRYLNKYFLGGGRILTSEVHALFSRPDVNLIESVTQITQPYIINDRSSLNDKISIGYYNQQGFTNYYLGNITSLRYFIAEHTFYNKATLDLSEEIMRLKYDIGRLETANIFNSFVSLTLIHDNTDNAVAPTKGFYHSITVGEGGLLPSLFLTKFKNDFYYTSFYKVSLANRFYFDLARNRGENVIATKFYVADNIQRGSGGKIIDIPPIYRYFSGGSNSIRGWNAKQLGMMSDRFRGGNFWLEGTVEFRKKLFPSSKTFTKNIGAVVFFDYGNAWERHQDFRWDQVAMAIGLGARYNLFIGPIRVDFGFKLYDPLLPEGQRWLWNNFGDILKKKLAINFGIGEAF